MPITLKLGPLLVPGAFAGKVSQILAEKVAPQLGMFFVRQVEYSHDVQGRDEDDRVMVWPARKVASTGLLIFGMRSAVNKAIKQLAKDNKAGVTAATYRVARNKNAPAGQQVDFTAKQIRGAALALAEEKKRKAFQKALKVDFGVKKTGMDQAKVALKATLKAALESGDKPKAAQAMRSMRLLAQSIGSGGSYARTANYLPRPVLLRTGTMKSSWTFRVMRHGPRVMVAVGTNVRYARQHEFGVPARGLPARRQFVVSRSDRADVQKLTQDTLARELRVLMQKG